jgi:hypothetical protein
MLAALCGPGTVRRRSGRLCLGVRVSASGRRGMRGSRVSSLTVTTGGVRGGSSGPVRCRLGMFGRVIRACPASG